MLFSEFSFSRVCFAKFGGLDSWICFLAVRLLGWGFLVFSDLVWFDFVFLVLEWGVELCARFWVEFILGFCLG